MSEVLDQLKYWTGEDRLGSLIEHYYDMKLTGVEPIRGVIKLTTENHGELALKRIRLGEKDRYRLLNELVEHTDKVTERSMQLVKPILTTNNQFIIHGFRHSFVLLPWVKGQEMELKTADEWTAVSRSLAGFHQSTRGFVPAYAYRSYQGTGKWSSQWKEAYKHGETCQLAATWAKTQSAMDQLWLNSAAYTLSLIEDVLTYFENMDGDQISLSSIRHGKACHGNLHRFNILQDEEKTQFVDWNELTLDVRAYDLANWLFYAYGKTGSEEIFTAILKGYNEVSTIEEEEYSLIYARLIFPDQLVDVLQAYYEEQNVGAEEAVSYLQSAQKVEDHRAQMLRKYVQVLKEEFAVSVPVVGWLHGEG